MRPNSSRRPTRSEYRYMVVFLRIREFVRLSKHQRYSFICLIMEVSPLDRGRKMLARRSGRCNHMALMMSSGDCPTSRDQQMTSFGDDGVSVA